MSKPMEAVVIQPTRERMQHDHIEPASQQWADSLGRPGAPFEIEGIVKMLEKRGLIKSVHRTAAYKYMDDWDIAGIENLRSAPLEILGKSRDSITDKRLDARDRWWNATLALGGLGAPTERACWYILGMRASLAQWVAIEGGRFTSDTAKGVLIGALAVLAQHYGLEGRAK